MPQLAWYTTYGTPTRGITEKYKPRAYHFCLNCTASQKIKCATLKITTKEFMEKQRYRHPCSKCVGRTSSPVKLPRIFCLEATSQIERNRKERRWRNGLAVIPGIAVVVEAAEVQATKVSVSVVKRHPEDRSRTGNPSSMQSRGLMARQNI